MDDNKNSATFLRRILTRLKKAAPDDLKEKQPVNVMDEVFEC